MSKYSDIDSSLIRQVLFYFFPFTSGRPPLAAITAPKLLSSSPSVLADVRSKAVSVSLGRSDHAAERSFYHHFGLGLKHD